MPNHASPIAREIARRFIGPDRYYSDDHTIGHAQKIDCLERIVDETLKAPEGDLRGSYPVLVYLGTEADRDELISLMLAANPNMRPATKL